MTATIRFNILRAIVILIFIAAAAMLLKPAFAEDATSSTTGKNILQQRIETRKENLQQRIDTKKVAVENRITAIKDKMASREAALKAKLDAFKDKRKAEIADRVNTNLNKINQNQVTQMLKHLQLMTTLLDKLEARVNQGTPDIKDPTAAKAAIASARTTVSAATSAVQTQAGKDYTIQVTSESRVKTDAQKQRDLLKTDLQAIRKQVIDAKQAVANAVRVAKSGSEATTSAKEGTSGQQ